MFQAHLLKDNVGDFNISSLINKALAQPISNIRKTFAYATYCRTKSNIMKGD